MTEILTEHKCLFCGGDIPEEKGNGAYCSNSCLQKTQYARKIGKEARYIYQKTCAICGEAFTTRKWQKSLCGKRHSRKSPLIEALCWTCKQTSLTCKWKESGGRQEVEGAQVLYKQVWNSNGKGIQPAKVGTVIKCPLYEKDKFAKTCSFCE